METVKTDTLLVAMAITNNPVVVTAHCQPLGMPMGDYPDSIPSLRSWTTTLLPPWDPGL